MEFISIEQLPSDWLSEEAKKVILLAGIVENINGNGDDRASFQEARKRLGREDIVCIYRKLGRGEARYVAYAGEAESDILLDRKHVNVMRNDC